MVKDDTQFIMRGGKAIKPDITQDGLELWYDMKGKTNTDTHNDYLLDLSGNNRAGTLQNFAFMKASGYKDGLVFDGIDDSLTRPVIDTIEPVSGSRNLLDKNSDKWEIGSVNGSVDNGSDYTSDTTLRSYYLKLKAGNYTFKAHALDLAENESLRFWVHVYDLDKKGVAISSWKDVGDDYSYTSETDFLVRILLRPLIDGQTYAVNKDYLNSKIAMQVEEGLVATPYTPYIPSAKMTYQLNGNILSYDEGGIVRRVQDGQVIERKGINLVNSKNWTIWNNRSSIEGRIGQKYVLSLRDYSFGRMIQTLNYKPAFNAYMFMRAEVEMLTNNIKYCRMFLRDGKTGAVVGDMATFTPSANKNKYIFERLIRNQQELFENESLTLNIDFYREDGTIEKEIISAKSIQLIDLTATYGAGNEPTLEDIQAEPDKWAWTPNPLDLLETTTLKGNIVGDVEHIIDDLVKDEVTGPAPIFTNKADDSVVRVGIDGKSEQVLYKDKTLEFNGVDGIIEMDTHLIPIENDFTLLFDIYYEGYSDYDTVFSDGGTSNAIKFFPDNTLRFRFSNAYHLISNPITNKVWNKIAITRNNSVLTIFINGKNETLQHSSTDLNISIRNIMSERASHRPVKGNIKNISVWDYAMSENEVATLQGRKIKVDDDGLIQLWELNEGRGETVTESKTGITGTINGAYWSSEFPELFSPDYPSEVVSLGNSFDVVSSIGGRNLMEELTITHKERWTLDESINGLKSIYTTNGWHKVCDIKRPVDSIQYTVSFWYKVKQGNLDNTVVHMVHNNNRGDRIGTRNGYIRNTPNEWSFYSETFSYYDETENIYFYINPRAADAEIWVNSLKIEEGPLATPYTPAPEEIPYDTETQGVYKTNITLDEPLRSVGDVHDKLFKDSDGLWKVERNVAKDILDGTESWGSEVVRETSTRFNCNIWGDIQVEGAFTSPSTSTNSHFPVNQSSYGNESYITQAGSTSTRGLYINMPNRILTTTEELKVWLSNNPVMILFARVPIIETLSDDLQLKLNAIESFDGDNYVYIVDDSGLNTNLTARFLPASWYKENLLINSLKVYSKPLNSEELLLNYQTEKERWGM